VAIARYEVSRKRGCKVHRRDLRPALCASRPKPLFFFLRSVAASIRFLDNLEKSYSFAGRAGGVQFGIAFRAWPSWS
jgi:hypothetical protein